MLTSALLLVSVAAPQDIASELDDLISATNALEGFSARYAIRVDGESAGTLSMHYEAPDRARLEWDSEALGGRMLVISEGVELCLSSSGTKGEAIYARFELPAFRDTLVDVLEERFPSTKGDEGSRLGPGPEFQWRTRYDEVADEHSFDLALNATRDNRSAVAQWLRALRVQSDDIERTETELVIAQSEFGWRIQRDTGFPSRVWFERQDKRASFELEALVLEAPDDAELFGFFERDADATDQSEQMERMFAGLAARQARWTCLGRIDRALEAGDVEWDAGTRKATREVLVALHGPNLAELGRAQVENFGDSLTEYEAWLSDRKREGWSVEELRTHAQGQWTGIAARHDELLTERLARFPDDESPEERGGNFEDLLTFEREVYAELFGERVTGALHRAFDERVEGVLQAG
jgi:hypothetical protein